MGKTKLSVVGAFVVVGFFLFGVGLFMIGDRRRLFDDSFEISAQFARLAGVQNGAKVRVSGIDAGEVVEIAYPRSPSEKFHVRMRVVEDLHPLVRRDSVASIQTDGLVGNKLIQIEAGTPSAPEVADGDVIEGREPFELQELMQKASNTVELLDETIEVLRDDVQETLATLGQTLDDAGTILTDVGQNVETVSKSAADITTDVQLMVNDVREGKGTLGKLVRDDALYEKTTEIADEIHRISGDAAEATENIKDLTVKAKSAFDSFGNGGSPAPGLMKDVQSTMTAAKEAMGDMAENMESLKRNFFFRGMFLDRGFFDLDSMSVDEYLQGNLRNKHHRTARIWISADELFEYDELGREKLSEQGKAKLDATLRGLLRYPPTSPLVVEGYSDLGSIDEQFRTARSRAVTVRDYILDEFHRDPNYTGYIALEGIEPVDVDADGGDGVVLALYYDNASRRAPRNRIH